tara:strand:- start:204 stop:545 length:342 start_codon:yes stop_codon:yes gene_type:complete
LKNINRFRRPKARPPKERWGCWLFVSSNLTLLHDNGYEIDLERINSCTEMLDLIFQLNHKAARFYGADVAKDLVEALDDIFKPQRNCCSWGKEKPFSGTKLAEAYALELLIRK